MKRLALFIFSTLISTTVTIAQVPRSTIVKDMTISGRLGYDLVNWDGYISNDNTGFTGEYVYLEIGGDLYKNLSYNYRQRLDNLGKTSFVNTMEELCLKWTATDKLHVTGGKSMIALGNTELQTHAINSYYNSEMWNRLDAYQFGVAVDYNVTSRDNIMLQISNSPIRPTNTSNLYAASIMWTGQHGIYSGNWSVNMMQYRGTNGMRDKQWMSYIMLGNRLTFNPMVYVDINLTHRMAMNDKQWGKDYTASAELSVKPIKSLRTYVKCTRDVNDAQVADKVVQLGTKINTASLGIELEPLKNRPGDVKLYVAGMTTWGENKATGSTYYEDMLCVKAGVKLRLDVLGMIWR